MIISMCFGNKLNFPSTLKMLRTKETNQTIPTLIFTLLRAFLVWYLSGFDIANILSTPTKKKYSKLEITDNVPKLIESVLKIPVTKVSLLNNMW